MSRPEPVEIDLAAAKAIAAALDPPLAAAGVARLPGGSTDVFEIVGEDGQAVILKVYADDPPWKLRKEAFVAGRFAPIAPVPRWLAIDESRSHLPRAFAVMTRLPGQALRVRFGQDDAERLFREMGALLKRLHDVPMPHHGYLLEADVALAFDTNAERMAVAFGSKYRDFRNWGGDAALCERIAVFVGERAGALAECGAPVLCHNDFHPGNVLVDADADGVWRISGLIDFENAVAGDPLFDLAKALDYTAHECPAGRAPLAEGYGPLTRPGAAEALLLYRIFHKLELLNWFKAIGEGRHGPATDALLGDLVELTGG